MPEIQPRITEYQFPNVVCAGSEGCGKTTKAPLPTEVKGHLGPQLTALVAYLTVACRQPRRVVEGKLADVQGIQISLGSTQRAWELMSQVVERPYQELQERLPREAVLNVDETGWRKNAEKRHTWAFVATTFAFYTISGSRGAEELVAMLGLFSAGFSAMTGHRLF